MTNVRSKKGNTAMPTDAMTAYHVCFAVPDLEAAMGELTAALGVRWGEPIRGRLETWDYSLVFSREAPHIELISSVSGSPWDTDSPRFHHMGFWAHCLDSTLDKWQDAGGEMFYDSRPAGRRFGYIDLPASGVRVEAVDEAQRESFLSTWVGGN